MSTTIDAVGLWLANYYLSATLLLVVTGLVIFCIQQPARRIAVVWIGLFGLILLAVVPSVPLWPRVAIGDQLAQRWAADPLGKAVVGPEALEANPWLPSDDTSTASALNERPVASEAPISPGVTSPQARRLAPPLVWSWNRLRHGAVCAFLFGFVFVGLRLGWGTFQAHRLCRDATTAAASLQSILARVASRKQRLPRLLVSSRVQSPLALGVTRPTIVLPLHFVTEETEEALTAALSHEWAHIRNKDLGLLGVSRLLMLLLFAHPLYWWLRRTVRDDQDLMADAAAAQDSGRPEYAQHLLEWTRGAQGGYRLAPAMAMWQRPSQLTTRIRALLNDQLQVEPRVSRGWFGAAVVALSLVILAISVVTFQPIAAAGTTSLGGAQTTSPNVLAGIVVDEAGNPIPDVRIDHETWVAGHESRTSADGRFRLTGFAAGEAAQIRFSKDGFSPQLFTAKRVGDSDWVVMLDRRTYFEGQVTAGDGRPVPHAWVRANQGPKRTGGGKLVRNIWTQIRTGKDGTYRLHVQPDSYEIYAQAPGEGRAEYQRIAIAHGEAKRLDIKIVALNRSRAGGPVPEPVVVRFRHELTDLEGEPLDSLLVGEEFQLRTYVKDLRASPRGGVFAGYLDLTYTAAVAQAVGPIQYGDRYPSARDGQLVPAGRIDNVGAVARIIPRTPLGADEFHLFTVRFVALNKGAFTVKGAPANSSPAHDLLVYGKNEPVGVLELDGEDIDAGQSPGRIDYGSTSLQISK